MSEEKQNSTDFSEMNQMMPKEGQEAIEHYLQLAGSYITELDYLYKDVTTPAEELSTQAGIASAIVNSAIAMASLRQNLAALVSDTIHSNMRELARSRTEGNNPPVAPPNF